MFDSMLGITEFLNDSTFVNNDTFNFNRYYNAGNFENNGQITATLDATNAGYWHNATGSQIDLNNNFTNGDSTSSTHNAILENDGFFTIGNNWRNLDTITGSSSGAFYIQNGTYNQGVMIGNFLFCDQTPTTGTEPIIDYNTGSIDTNITYCSVNIRTEDNSLLLSVFPNPVNDILYVTGKTINLIKLYDISGKQIFAKQVNKEKNRLEFGKIQPGIYFLKIFSNRKVSVKKIIVK